MDICIFLVIPGEMGHRLMVKVALLIYFCGSLYSELYPVQLVPYVVLRHAE